jgi:arylsulfatase A-like enzyme/tetratricopeptide (TPR) repeat protein
MQVVRLFVLLAIVLSFADSASPQARVPGQNARSAPTTSDKKVNSAHPNIILFTLDTTRGDRMGFLGSNRGLTPNLDHLAEQSVVFTRAYAQVPLTTPSHAALLTGTYPQFNHIEDLGAPLGKDLPYLPDILHQQGYHTAAFIGAYILDPWSKTAIGFERGFDFYDTDYHARRPGEDRYKSVERRAEDVANRALKWISTHPQRPFFVWLHFYDAHDPYDPPSPFKEKYASFPYDGEIAYTDSVVGSFLRVLNRHGLYQNSVIAIAADHGEAFGEHGEQRHGMFLYDETIHVPLLLKMPGAKFAGKRIETRVALADVAPSLLDVAGVAVPKEMQAQSVLPLIEGDQKGSPAATKVQEQPVYSETNYPHRGFGWAELESWRAGKYLYVQAPKRELYDQSADPEAQKNLASSSTAIADTLQGQLADFHQKTSSAQTEHAQLDPSQAESLRALGYLASDNTSAKGSQKSSTDPKDKIDIANEMHRALVDLEEDQYEEAIPELRDVIQKEPDVSTGYLELGRALVHEKKYEEAIPILRTAASKQPDSAMAHYELALALIKFGEWEMALPEVQAAVVCNPKSAQMHFYAAAVHLKLKHFSEATAEFDKALELDPKHYLANLKYGEMLLAVEGDPKAALPKLVQAAKVQPDSPEAHAFLARAYDALGQAANANHERSELERLKSAAAQPEQ